MRRVDGKQLQELKVAMERRKAGCYAVVLTVNGMFQHDYDGKTPQPLWIVKDGNMHSEDVQQGLPSSLMVRGSAGQLKPHFLYPSTQNLGKRS